MTEAAHDDYQLPEEFEHCLKLAPVRDAPSALDRVKQVVRILHEPGGCPWDGEQTNTSLLKPLLEETYEYIDAVETNDRDNMREELGDMLLQSVFQAQVCAVDAQGMVHQRVVGTQVHFCPMTEEEIRRYIATGEPMDKAGAYAVQGIAGLWIDKLEGSYSNVIGLPMHTVRELLDECGLHCWRA